MSLVEFITIRKAVDTTSIARRIIAERRVTVNGKVASVDHELTSPSVIIVRRGSSVLKFDYLEGP